MIRTAWHAPRGRATSSQLADDLPENRTALWRPTPWQFAAIVATICASSAAVGHAAPPKLTAWMPVAVARGASVSMTASGTFDTWPVDVWVDRPGLTLKAQEKKGVFQAETTADAVAGVYLIRLYNAQGASELRPIIVSTGVVESLEKEPNDARQASQQLQLPAAVSGKLAKSGDVDSYRVRLRKGENLTVRVTANQVLNSPMDAVLQVCLPEGFVLEQNDDERGLDPQIVFLAPADGEYLVRLFAFPSQPNSSIRFAGADTYVYRLEATAGPLLDYTLPLAVEANQSAVVQCLGQNLTEELQSVTLAAERDERFAAIFHPQAAGAVRLPRVPMPSKVMPRESSPEAPWKADALPLVVSGQLEEPGDEDAVLITGTKGQKLLLEVAARQLGFPTDPQLRVLDEAGKVVAEADDAARDQRDVKLSFSPPADGAYRVVVRDVHRHGGWRHAYRLTVSLDAAAFKLVVPTDAVIVKAGGEAEVTVNVTRSGGHAKAIRISLDGLPAGVECEAATSEAKGATAKTVKLKLKASPDNKPHNGPLRVVGTVGDKSSHAECGTHQLHQLWLTVTK